MRVALVSPYSWTYPGGVMRHIEALAAELLAAGHEVRVLAPFDEDARRAALLHRGVRPPRRAPAPRRATAAPRGSRVARAARPDSRLAVERRGLQPLAHALRDRHAA